MIRQGYLLALVAVLHLLLSLLVSRTWTPLVANVLALTPANSFFVHFYLWNVFTYPLIDRNIALAVINVIIFLSAGRYVQRMFQRTFYEMLAFVVVATGFSIFWIEMSLFIFTRWETFLFYEFSGMGVVSAILVISLKFLIGKKPVFPRAFPALKFNHLPFILIIASLIFLFSSGTLSKEFLPISLGLYYSWLYIRFFRIDPSTGIVGSVSVDFQLDALFPSPVRPTLAAVFSIAFKIITILGCCKTYLKQNESFLVSVSNGSSPVAAQAENAKLQDEFSIPSDRRKKIAMQAIDEKLKGLRPDHHVDIESQGLSPVPK